MSKRLEALGEPKAIAALETGGQAWAEKETQTKVESGPWVCGLRKLGDELFTNTRPYAALQAAGLDWIVRLYYSLGSVHFEREYTF